MHRTLYIAAAALLFAGHATAETPRSDGFRIESEDQFARDYADSVERIDAGVYLVTKGALAGRTITLGESGLAYDLAALRARVPASGRERSVLQSQVKRLQRTAERFERQRSNATTRASQLGAIQCSYFNWSTRQTIWYSGTAYVSATAEYYMSNGGGGLNPYYARAAASANGSVSAPPGVPFGSGSLSAHAVAWNRNTNVIAQKFSFGNYPNVSSGYVYSGPDFSHNLEAFSGVEGEGDCLGYVGISANLQ
ncbi:hypothetical protein [Lysobacter brunescens]|uniref:Secreted protein n=1 Tax=Lysobacter brunescens TaxID=262323 RepID=A0ABW2Y8L2_9GAMM